MTLPKKHLEVFFNALRETEGVLSLSEARKRDPFMKIVGDHLNSFYTDRTKIYETFCDKTEEGKPDIKDGKYHFAPELLEQINGELVTLADEEVELTIPEGMKDILDKTTYKPKFGEVEIIDEISAKL